MMHAERQRDGLGMYGCCGPMMRHGPRYCGVIFGIMLVFIGALWLAARTGWLDPELFWPVAFLTAGFVVIALALTRGRKTRMIHGQNGESRNQDSASPKI